MSKSIKVTEEVYQELRGLQRTRETFNDIIARLIAVEKGLMGLYIVVGGVKAFGEWQQGQVKKDELVPPIGSMGHNTGDDESP